MAGLANAPLVTDIVLPPGTRKGRRLAGLRGTPGRLRAGLALMVLLA
jgi:hypothetical protein